MDVFHPVQIGLGGENEVEKKTGDVQIDEKDEGNIHLPGQSEDNNCIDEDKVVAINTEEDADGHIELRTHRIELYEPQVEAETNKGSCSDEVVPFVLDEDFDYDNVILTPKFTIREFKELPK